VSVQGKDTVPQIKNHVVPQGVVQVYGFGIGQVRWDLFGKGVQRIHHFPIGHSQNIRTKANVTLNLG
jgi:hypothetical protein